MSDPQGRDKVASSELALLRLICAVEALLADDAESLDHAADLYSELEAAVSFAKQNPEVQRAAVQEILDFYLASKVPTPNEATLAAVTKSVAKQYPNMAFHSAVGVALSEAKLFGELLAAARSRVHGKSSVAAFREAVEAVCREHSYVLASAEGRSAPEEPCGSNT